MKKTKLLPVLGICAIAPTLPVMITSCGGDKTGNKIKVTNATAAETKAHLDKLQVPTEVEKGKDLVITLSSHSGWVIDSEKTDIKIGDDSLTADEMTIDYDNGTITIANVKIEAHGSKNITVLVAVREAEEKTATISKDTNSKKIESITKTEFKFIEKQSGSTEINFTTYSEKCVNESCITDCKNCSCILNITGKNGKVIISWTAEQAKKAMFEGMSVVIKDNLFSNTLTVSSFSQGTIVFEKETSVNVTQGQSGSIEFNCSTYLSHVGNKIKIYGDARELATINSTLTATDHWKCILSWTAEQSYLLAGCEKIQIGIGE